MNIFVYSDESGVFDPAHNDLFVFGGLIFLSKEEKDVATRKYIKAEKDVRASMALGTSMELKASVAGNKYKGKLYRSLNQIQKFSVIIDQKRIHPKICSDKKSKQRYLDYAYKIAIKRAFEAMIASNKMDPRAVENLYFFVDEHTTATNGRYELQEALEQEFKIGTFNEFWQRFYPPIFPNLKSVQVEFCDSASRPLVRAADMVANKVFHCARTSQTYTPKDSQHAITLP